MTVFHPTLTAPSRRARPPGLLAVCGLSLACLLLGGCDETPVNAAPAASPWAAIAKGSISIEGGVINIAATRPGIIRQVLAEEGAEVKGGTILARIDDGEAKLALRVREQEYNEARPALALLQLRHGIAQRELKRLAGLAGDDVVSDQERDQARDQVGIAAAEVARQQAALATSGAHVAAAKFEVEQHLVRAPLDGRIVRRQARPGDGASTLNVTPLFLFAPHGPRIVRADLEERFVGAVKAGQAAEVALEADESKVYKARVLRLGQVFGNRPESDDPNEKQDVRVIECVLQIDAPELRIGQRVIVRIARQNGAAAP
ncbi:HlyD family secretion protein [Janthinobacterium fluminis]|uniref:HlyD family efflux transporter periplasmic adaptor subunit n=1 Tax=Janthinobacterium fluminis TaxID=2987524 RepID=A0ABT5JZA7_9BURK|nr:HlyD family efflux transporter periplasmic adaptor subunit [Janthinobacterium fluminis]MDC8758063.1 HlyD family efflux transporter periplasmic adaptor subunit [Janthinobacterium fluminis]